MISKYQHTPVTRSKPIQRRMSISLNIKWAKIGLMFLLVASISYIMLTRDDTNARVAKEIRASPDGDRAQKTMLLTLADGRMYPVNFLYEGNRVYMGIDGLWWREFVEEAQPVQMFIRGENYSGYARTVLDDRAYKIDVFSRLRPSVPKWLPDFLDAKFVVVTLED